MSPGLPRLPGPGETLTLDPANPQHQALVRLMLQGRAAPVVMPQDTLSAAPTPMQRVKTAADLEALERAEAKRRRKALKLR